MWCFLLPAAAAVVRCALTGEMEAAGEALKAGEILLGVAVFEFDATGFAGVALLLEPRV